MLRTHRDIRIMPCHAMPPFCMNKHISLWYDVARVNGVHSDLLRSIGVASQGRLGC